MSVRRRILGMVAGVALAFLAGACASADEPAAADAAVKAGPTCFNVQNITNIDPLPGPYLYIGMGTESLRVGNSKHYLLTLDRPSERLRIAMHIQISPDYPRVCSNMRVPLTYEYNGHVGVYNIVNVEAVKDRQEAEALAAKRTAEPRSENDTASPPPEQ